MKRQTLQILIFLGLASVIIAYIDNYVGNDGDLDANEFDLDEELHELHDPLHPSIHKIHRILPSVRLRLRVDPITNCDYKNEKVCKDIQLFGKTFRFCYYRMVNMCI